MLRGRQTAVNNGTARYSGLKNEYIAAQIRFTDDFDMILYRDETLGESVYAARRDAGRDLTDVIEYLSC
jgi:hypothetical protein